MTHVPTPTDPLAASLDARSLPDPQVSLDLLAKARGGDEAALNELVARYHDRLRRIVRAKLGSRLRRHMDSVDIVQGTFRTALPRLRELRPDSAAGLLQWLALIALNQIRDESDRWNAAKRDGGREVGLDACDAAGNALVAEPAAAQVTPSIDAWHRELEQMLDEAVRELPQDQHEVVIMRDYCGEDWDEIARKLGRKNTHAARQLHQRAWIRLRQVLGPRLKDVR